MLCVLWTGHPQAHRALGFKYTHSLPLQNEELPTRHLQRKNPFRNNRGYIKALDVYNDFTPPRSIMTYQDLDSIILFDSIQEALTQKKEVVPHPICPCCKRFSSTCEEWKAALKEIADLRAVQEANRISAEAIKAIFATQPATPENISTQIINHIVSKPLPYSL